MMRRNGTTARLGTFAVAAVLGLGGFGLTGCDMFGGNGEEEQPQQVDEAAIEAEEKAAAEKEITAENAEQALKDLEAELATDTE
jgi:uncharacterized protein HemX